jgi:hypothetical protein
MSVDRPARARAEYNPMRDSVSIVASPSQDTIVIWGEVAYRTTNPDTAVDAPEAHLHLREDLARALYEALGRYFGGDAVDARQLRQDYEAERRRVDKFIDAAIRSGGAV